MKNEIRNRENQKETERARNENRKTYLLLQFSRGCRPRVEEREKTEKKRESGRETVTNVTFDTNIIVIDILSYDIIIYLYKGVKLDEKRASSDTYSIM